VSGNVRSFLASGPEENLQGFHLVAVLFLGLNQIDRRKQTVRYACLSENADSALQAARQHDVTLQEIVVVGTENPETHDLGGGARVTISDSIEEYPVLHEGTHLMRWKPRRGKGSAS
jgi:hypothetical protein